MKKLALLLSLLALGALGLVALGGSDDDEATAASETETTRDRTTRDELAADLEADPARKSCGAFRFNGPDHPPIKVTVVEGDVPCRVARRVMKASSAENRGGQTAATTQSTLAPVEEIAGIGTQWARVFAAGGRAACKLMTQPACERASCESVGGRTIKNCTPLSSEFRKSFTDETVRLAIRGDKAAAKFSNGEVVKLELDGTGWLISRIGGNAGKFYREVALGAEPASKFCGGFLDSGHYGLIKVEVVEGDVPCRVARRVLKRLYLMGLPPATGSWSCYGPEGLIECYKKPGKTIRAHFPGDNSAGR